MGYDLLTADDTAHDPFLRLALASEHSERALLASSVAIAFGRSPWVTAQQAWAIQRLSGGRLVLGLGTQVKGHIERRFSMPWGPPGPRLREYIECLRAIWSAWQDGTPPNYEGRYFRFTLMNPGSNPGPIDYPDIPVTVAAVNPYNARLGGEVADGVVFHPFSTFRYMREVLMPAVLQGAQRAGRGPGTLRVHGGGFIATGPDDAAVAEARERARRRISYYGSTPAYRGVLDLHGWGEIFERLHTLSRDGRWDEMVGLVDDRMLDEFCLTATWEQLPEVVAERYAGIATEVSLPAEARSADEARRLAATVEALRAISASVD